jgi:hypothetical protein
MTDDSSAHLRWLLSSPPLFRDLPGIPLMPDACRKRLLMAWERLPAAAAPESKSPLGGARRLGVGHHAEHLLTEALRRCPGIEVIASRQQIRVGDQTIGEIDLLYDDHERQCRVHCEMSVRIVLQHHPAADWTAWCGTDPRQGLQDKLDHLREHQLPLGGHPLVPRHPRWPTISEALLLGWFLQPTGQTWPEPAHAAPDHLRGWWLRHGIAEPLRSSRAARFSIIPTRDWLGPLKLPASTPVLAPGQLSELVTKHFARHDHALLIAELVRDSDGGWRELNRGAMVHRHWPKPGRHG